MGPGTWELGTAKGGWCTINRCLSEDVSHCGRADSTYGDELPTGRGASPGERRADPASGTARLRTADQRPRQTIPSSRRHLLPPAATSRRRHPGRRVLRLAPSARRRPGVVRLLRGRRRRGTADGDYGKRPRWKLVFVDAGFRRLRSGACGTDHPSQVIAIVIE